MKRHLAPLLAASALCLPFAHAAEQEFYSLRTYQLHSPEKAAAFDKMMAAAIPIMQKAGIGSVGVFKSKSEKDGDPNWRHVLSATDSLDNLVAARKALAANADFLEQARDYLSNEKSDPAYARISASTFVAFAGFPKLAVPEPDQGGERFFELRIYESHNEFKAYMKVAMFDDAEIDIFKDTGLRPVFFGSALSGDNLPNLTYMLVYDNEREKKQAWDAFRTSPAWQALKGEEKYKDTVSKITSLFLVATDYSPVR